VLESAEVPPEFHARKSARAKTYRYRIFRGAICSPFVARYVWHFPYPLEEEAMAAAAGVVVGEHNFSSFAAVDAERGKGLEHEGYPSISLRAGSGSLRNHDLINVRQIFSSAWQREGDEFVYTVRGSGFLHHMVRNLVGTFILVGKKTLTVEDVKRILEARERSAAGATAPASGLCLMSVEYLARH
jgi:tRNA pseudouridine38-40 synthase